MIIKMNLHLQKILSIVYKYIDYPYATTLRDNLSGVYHAVWQF